MLSLEAVEKVFQTAKNQHCALKDIHLEVVPGEIFGVLGRNHAGKTTLLRCAHFIESINSGSIMMDNSFVSLMNEKALNLARRTQGMIFADPLLLVSRTVYENVALPLQMMGIKRQECRNRVDTILQITGLQDKRDSYPSSLTLGQQYRTSIARALVHQPKILLCDDITKGCDIKTTHGLLKLLRELNDRHHFTIILATQDMEVIKTICHRVAILHQGEIVEQNDVKTIYAHPKTEIAKEFVKSATRLEMPTALRRRLKSTETEHAYPVLRLTIDNNPSQETLIAQAIQNFGLTMNILQAHLETLRDDHIGVMIIELRGKKQDIQSAKTYLEEKGLHIEVLGYVL